MLYIIARSINDFYTDQAYTISILIVVGTFVCTISAWVKFQNLKGKGDAKNG